MRGVISKATTTKWYVLGRWAYGEDTILRTSVGGQGDAEWIRLDRHLLREGPPTHVVPAAGDALPRRRPATATPRLRLVGAVASDAPNQKPSIPTPLGGAEGITLAVPQYSQEIARRAVPPVRRRR